MNPQTAYAAVVSESDTEAAAHRLIEVYDCILRANAVRNRDGALHGLALLRASLRPDNDPALAHNLARIYDQVERAIREKRHAEAGRVIEEVRGLWLARMRCDTLRKHENNEL